MGLTACRLFGPYNYGSPELQQAEEFLRQKKYDQAVGSYEKHMTKRLARKDRPTWENPYFYLLMIGDTHLRADQPEQALAAYSDAESRDVDSGLISDRYRSLAAWYENHGRFQEALNILSKHRNLDSLLFDSMMDRIAKDMVKFEDTGKAPPTPTAEPADSESPLPSHGNLTPSFPDAK